MAPHVPATNPDSAPFVWAVDTRHAPFFWFPRDCPRACLWLTSDTTDADRERFFGSGASRVHALPADWVGRTRACRLYAYRLPSDCFEPAEVGGVWVSTTAIDPVERVTVDDLIGLHARAGIELRVVPSLVDFWSQVIASTAGFSGWRLRNARPQAVG